MDGLEKKLHHELLRDPNVKLLDSSKWSLPIQTFDVEFETVKRNQMDILMKMLLIAFKTSGFGSAEEVSSMLVVEPLFIEDMINRMSRAGMIVKSDGVYSLTASGHQQLDTGIYVQPPEQEEATVYYSPTHETFLTGETAEGEGESYRYAKDVRKTVTFSDGEWRQALEPLGVANAEGSVQKVIEKITAVNELEKASVTCYEYRLHQPADDRLYARVWNTMTGEWDETLEAQIIEREIAEWRKNYLKK
ncbi:hypothetical protein SLU01_07780 [Sporosarcina luteola]|uniref:Uncharacterized protein n=1 Tax=Sporosarcina luteola TaxID=582850 RepID=A0A511Z4U8_9BACL|nr:hypothetical protein [Sporosarcina luteola]GEN82466.1 hypothetical protein SLU01_07780 [Sporosarcina luteola]